MSTTEWAKNPQTNAPRSITEPAAPEPLGDSEGTATQVVAGLEPVAFMTHHDDPMLFPTWGEAVQYCDDDESPISLFHADDVAKLQAENEALRKDAERWRFFRIADWADWNAVFRVDHDGLSLPELLDKATDAAMKG